MRIPLDRNGGAPLYKQIQSYLREGILSGGLPPEMRLPATRQLARDLGVNRITVETAYAELEADGLILSRIGSGTYVLPPYLLPAPLEVAGGDHWPLWQQDIQPRGQLSIRAAPDQMLEAAGHPHPVSFAGGVGDARLFPADDLRKAIQSALRRDGIAALGYGETDGYIPLRGTIAHVLTSQGLAARPEDILITAGSQQALVLVAQLLLRPGDAVLVEDPTYGGALDLFRLLKLRIVGISTDEDGMQVERLERLLQQHHPKLIYTIPNFQNPTGASLGSQRRRQLVAMADRFNVPILEDDFVGDLRYDGRAQPSLKALDPGGRVIYVSTFSKMLMPGLRVGFLVADGPVRGRLTDVKRANDLVTSNLIQRALCDFVSIGRYRTHLRRSCYLYRTRRDAMLSAIKRYIPAGVKVVQPDGGLFLWLRLPEPISAEDLLPLACQEGISFAPGTHFFVNPSDGTHCMRLNFADHLPEEIEEGIKRLGKVMERYARQTRSALGQSSHTRAARSEPRRVRPHSAH